MEFADVISAHYSEDSKLPALIVSGHLNLTAANLGLGTCWIAARSASRPPADKLQEKICKPLRELTCYDHW